MNANVTINPMRIVLTLANEGRKIEAIKAFRAGYGGGLREAKDAIEALLDPTMPRGPVPTEYLVLSRYDIEDDYQVIHADSREAAMQDASDIVNNRVEVAVVGVVARSVVVTVRAMTEVA